MDWGFYKAVFLTASHPWAVCTVTRSCEMPRTKAHGGYDPSLQEAPRQHYLTRLNVTLPLIQLNPSLITDEMRATRRCCKLIERHQRLVAVMIELSPSRFNKQCDLLQQQLCNETTPSTQAFTLTVTFTLGTIMQCLSHRGISHRNYIYLLSSSKTWLLSASLKQITKYKDSCRSRV